MKPKTDPFMLSESLRGNKAAVLFMAVVGFLFYLMNLYTPLFCDDWFYRFIFGTTTPIASIGDIFVSQYRHYFEFNGRLVPHLFVQFFDGFAGKSWFNVVNTVILLLFLHLLVTTVTKERNQYYKILTLAVAVIVFLLPAFNVCFLWMTGACNYLWTGTFILFFHIMLRKVAEMKPYMYPLLFFIGLFCGWTHEGFVIGLSAGYIVHFSINRKELIPSRVALLAGFCLGVLMMLVSPANIHKAMLGMDGANLLGVIKVYLVSLTAMTNLKLFFVLLALLVLIRIRNKELFRTFVHNNLIWLVAVSVAFVFVAFTKYASPHSRIGIELFSLIPLLRLCLHVRIPKAICSVWNGFTCCFFIFAVLACRDNYSEHKYQKSQIENKKNFIIRINKPQIYPVFQRFTVVEDYSLFCDCIENYFNRTSFVTLPSAFLDDIKRNPSLFIRFHTDEDLPFYAKRIPKGQNISDVTFLLRKAKEEEVPFYFRPFADRLSRFSATEIKAKGFRVVDIYGQSYLLVDKNEIIDYRVRDITYKTTQATE